MSKQKEHHMTKSDENKIQMRDWFLWSFKVSARQYIRDMIHSDNDWEAALRNWFSDEDLAVWKAYEAGWTHSREITLEEMRNE